MRSSPNSQPVHDEQGNVYHILPDISNREVPAYAKRPLPGPLAAARASSPMKKSRSSVPLFTANEPPLPPVPPVRNEGLFATAGRPDPEPPDPPTPPFVAIAVGNTNEGESLPAKPWELSNSEDRS